MPARRRNRRWSPRRSPGRALAAAVVAAWDAGEAVLPLNPPRPPAERDRLLDAAAADPRRTTATAGGRSPTACPVAGRHRGGRRHLGHDRRAQGRRADARRHGGDGPRLLGRRSTPDRATAGSRACRCTTSPASACSRARTSPACRGPCTTASTSTASRASPRAEGTTIVSLVPTTLRRLLDAGAPLHEYRRVIVGGAPCPPALRARAEAAGVRVVDAYGHDRDVGRLRARRRPDRGRRGARSAADGEILVRGAMVMRGYRLDPDADRRRARTRRLAAHRRRRRDRRRRPSSRVVDRKKDLVITGGVNVSPTEVEGVLAHHPDVARRVRRRRRPTTSGASASSRSSSRPTRRAAVARRRCARSRASSCRPRSCRASCASSTRSRAARAASRCGACSATVRDGAESAAPVATPLRRSGASR